MPGSMQSLSLPAVLTHATGMLPLVTHAVVALGIMLHEFSSVHASPDALALLSQTHVCSQ